MHVCTLSSEFNMKCLNIQPIQKPLAPCLRSEFFIPVNVIVESYFPFIKYLKLSMSRMSGLTYRVSILTIIRRKPYYSNGIQMYDLMTTPKKKSLFLLARADPIVRGVRLHSSIKCILR